MQQQPLQPAEAIQNINIIRHLIPAAATFPNNALLPLLVYEKVLQLPGEDPDKLVVDFFETNDWINAWVNGVYDYHHYHSTAHEVLGVIRGSARIQFGGPEGVTILIAKGDTVIIPAGVAHKAVEIFDDFACVGAYPSDQTYDLCQGDEADFSDAVLRIKEVSIPIADPVYGTEGPLITNWKK